MADPIPYYPEYVFGMDTSVWSDRNDTEVRPDFQLAYDRGVEFNFHRASFGLYKDSDYDVNWANSRKTPMLLGSYHFLIWDKSPEQQAEFYWNIVKNDPGELPLIVDFEWWSTIPSNAFDLLYRYLEKLKTLCGNRRIGIYTAYSFWKQYGRTDMYWKQYVLWLARYEQTPPIGSGMVPLPWTECDFWQFTGHGDGLYYGLESGDADLNYFMGSWNELMQLCNLETGENMWENNALIVAFEKTGSSPEAATVDFVALKNSGVHAVLLRCGTSSSSLNYNQPDAGYIDDPTFKTWFRAATSAGLRVLIDYDFNAMLDSVNAYDGSVTQRHINYLLSGGMKPSVGGGLLLNMERHIWTEGTRTITCMANMFGKDAQNVFNQIWNKYRLVPGIRTGKWFLSKTDDTNTAYETQMIFMDQGEANVPLFLARPKKTGLTVTGNFHSVIADIPDPSTQSVKALDGTTLVNEQAYYLYYGNKTKWSGWEIAWIKNAAVKDASGVMALFRLILWNGNTASFDNYFNFPQAASPSVSMSASASASASVSPSPSPSSEIPPDLELRVEALEADMETIRKALLALYLDLVN